MKFGISALVLFAGLGTDLFALDLGGLVKKTVKTDGKSAPAPAAAPAIEAPKGPVAAASFSIQSARLVGDKLVVVGKASATKKVNVFMGQYPEAVLADAKLEVSELTWAGKSINLAAGLEEGLEEGLPVTWQAVLDTKGQKVAEIPKLRIRWEEGVRRQGVKFDSLLGGIKVPSEADTALVPGTIEIARKVYLRLKPAQTAKGILKIQFALDNRSGKEFELKMSDAALVDDQGNEVSNPQFFVGNKAATYEDPKLAADVVVAGRLEFKTALKPSSVKLLRFAVEDGRAQIRHALRDPKLN